MNLRAGISHAAAFVAGAAMVTALSADGAPRTESDRYRTLDAFAQSLSYIETQYVDPVDEKALIYAGIKGMLAQLDEHSSFLAPRRYERLAIYRPMVPVGRAEVGFLPGGLDEKLDPWMSAIHDALVALTDRRSSRDARTLIDELIVRGTLSLESVTFLRGRSLHRQFTIVDEAQNLEPATLKTILTRIGEGTKVVFTGDTSQIDAPYLGERNNALAVLIHEDHGAGGHLGRRWDGVRRC